MNRTRYFLVGSALIVVVGLCTGLVAYYNGNLSLGKPAIGPVELSYLPADAKAVAFANVQGIMTSEFRQQLTAGMPTGEEKNRLLEETGIDIEHDIDRVVFGMPGTDGPVGNGVVLVRGRFDTSRIEVLAAKHGATVEDYRGKKLLVSPAPVHVTVPGPDGQTATPAPTPVIEGAGRPAMAFLEGGLIAFGGTDALRRAIDAAATSNNITDNADLMSAVAAVEGSSDAWVVGRVDAMTASTQMPEHVRSQVSGIQWFSVTANVDRALRGTLRAECVDEKAAEQLRQIVNGGLAAARMFAGRDPKLDSALKALQPGGTGRTVELSFDITPETLQLLHSVGQPRPDGSGMSFGFGVEPERQQ